MDLYKAMFYCNVESERDNNFIKAESLRIELIAGGLNWKQQEFIMERLQPNSFFEVNLYSVKSSDLWQAFSTFYIMFNLQYFLLMLGIYIKTTVTIIHVP